MVVRNVRLFRNLGIYRGVSDAVFEFAVYVDGFSYGVAFQGFFVYI